MDKTSDNHSTCDAEGRKTLVFLNSPIHDAAEDIIGFQAHVDTLQAAIDAGAHMIAITSPFGAGKSSVTELLRSNRDDQQVVNVSMWSHLCKENNNDTDVQTLELHRSFLYQTVSTLDSKKGSYISRRLSKNYGLLKLHTQNIKYYLWACISLAFFIFGYVLPYVFHVTIPTVWGQPDLWNGFFVMISVISLVYVITRAEIVFSSNKSEGALVVDENEIIELYRKFVLEHCNQSKLKKFIFVIEDLDRTDKQKCVINFLKELRKYYIIGNCENPDQYKIVFIVNVKPETSLHESASIYKNNEKESLYAKLFDFVLNIQTINIDDYETVLESILQRHKDTILKMFPDSNVSRFVDIPGMQWIIRGRNFGIRDIKDRLNRAFALYRSLITRFPASPIDFQKCAAVAYLTTAYEQDFISTDDRDFAKLVEIHMQQKLDENICINTLGDAKKAYAKEVFILIDAKLIDSNYRMYFYNYPRNSKIYSHDEHAVQNAILYGELIDDLGSMALRVANNNTAVIYEALDRLEKLKIPLPDLIFKNEPLYIATLHHYQQGIYEWIEKLDYSANSIEKACKQLSVILTFDHIRSVYSCEHAIQFCNIWEERIKENELLRFRYNLCSQFPEEILWYEQLFMGVHNIVTVAELDLLDLKSAIQLTNIQKDAFNEAYIQYILERLEKEVYPEQQLINDVQVFLTSAEKKLGSSTTVPYFLQFMHHLQMIIPEYEESVMRQLTSVRTSSEQKDKLFQIYQALINSIAPESIMESTLKNIQTLDRFNGYTEGVSNALINAGYVFESNLIRLHLGIHIDVHSMKTIAANKENLDWLLMHIDVFMKLRLSVIEVSDEKNIFGYDFLFSEACPILCVNEFSKVQHRFSDDVILKLIPASIVTANEVPMLTGFFNRQFRSNRSTFDYLMYIAKMHNSVAKECFYKLNFDYAIKYSTYAATRKKLVKDSLWETLGLDATSEKIRFMEATRFMDSAWEESIETVIKSNSTLQKSYIEAANHAVYNSITKSTIKCICSFSAVYALNDIITARLLLAKKYMHYVLSKTAYHKKFILDAPEQIDNLWETYLEIFTSSSYPNIRDCMDSNLDFLEMIMEKGAYTTLSNERRNILAKIHQDANSLQEVMKRGDSFASSYYQSIAGFKNESAAEAFISIMEDRQSLLRSQAIYNHCHEKLISSTLKAKYTRLRKKHGYMS